MQTKTKLSEATQKKTYMYMANLAKIKLSEGLQKNLFVKIGTAPAQIINGWPLMIALTQHFPVYESVEISINFLEVHCV